MCKARIGLPENRHSGRSVSSEKWIDEVAGINMELEYENVVQTTVELGC